MNRTFLKLRKFSTAACLTLIFASFAWSQKHDINTSQQQDGDVKIAAAQFLVGHELKLEQAANLREQFILLVRLAPAALAAGETEKARYYAQQLPVVANKIQSQSKSRYVSYRINFAVHISNIILGRIALESGDTKKAKEHLLAAGRITGRIPPTLASFGPNMLLAKHLIEKGERETVIQYFDLCANFWKIRTDKLEQWKKDVKEDKMPDFGFNLGAETSYWRSAQ